MTGFAAERLIAMEVGVATGAARRTLLGSATAVVTERLGDELWCMAVKRRLR
jgi:hypothetical protein